MDLHAWWITQLAPRAAHPLWGKGQRNSTVRVRTVCQEERQMDWEPRCWAVTLLSGLEAPMEVFICLLSGSSNPRSDLLPGPELPDDALCTMTTNLTTKNIHHSTVYGSCIYRVHESQTLPYTPQSFKQADHLSNLIKSRSLALEQDTCSLIPASCVTLFKSLTFLGFNSKMRKTILILLTPYPMGKKEWNMTLKELKRTYSSPAEQGDQY